MAFDDPDEYMRWYASNPRLYHEELELIRRLDLGNCVDVGSGPSVFHEAISGAVISLDLSYAMLRAGRPDEDRIQGSALSLPFRNSCLDCISSIASIMFFKDLSGFLKEARRVLRPGGTLAICSIPLDSQLGKVYVEMGRAGDKYYRNASFLTRDELRSEIGKLFEIEGASCALEECSFYCVLARKPREPYNGEAEL
ncbi:MAG TPA: class I SAM-dependent methyltransferase [Thermoprotei archaeon]|nr:class I SAM-dependent methyltransferase [Thermoprotei archaeon]